jgi:hypothetical protein
MSGASAENAGPRAAERRPRPRCSALLTASFILNIGAIAACGRETVDLLPSEQQSRAGAPAHEPGAAGFRPGVDPSGGSPGYGGEAAAASGGWGGVGGDDAFEGGHEVGCLSNPGVCALTEVCDPFTDRCVPPCTSNAVCDFPQVYCDRGICVECFYDRDCAASGLGRHCLAGACFECNDDAECPSNRPVCDRFRYVCGCWDDDDCGPGRTCNWGVCQP